jgi:hypothetical protein
MYVCMGAVAVGKSVFRPLYVSKSSDQKSFFKMAQRHIHILSALKTKYFCKILFPFEKRDFLLAVKSKLDLRTYICKHTSTYVKFSLHLPTKTSLNPPYFWSNEPKPLIRYVGTYT